MANAPEDNTAYDYRALTDEEHKPSTPEPKDSPEHDAWLWARYDG